MKKLFIIIVFALFTTTAGAQEAKSLDEYQSQQTSYDRYINAAVNIVHTFSFEMPKIYCKGGTFIETSVKKVLLLDDSSYFAIFHYYYFVTKTDYYASLSYDEIKDLLSALEILIEQSKKDVLFTDVYIENIWKSKSGFKLGYFTENGKVSWFSHIDYHRYSFNTLKDINQVVSALIHIKSKMEYLM